MAHHTWHSHSHRLSQTVVPTAGWLGATDWSSADMTYFLFNPVSLCSLHGGGGCSSLWNKEHKQHLEPSNKLTLPGYSYPKNGSWGHYRLVSPPFSTMIYPCCRRGRISPSSCSLPPILLVQGDEIDIMEVGEGLTYQCRDQRDRRMKRINFMFPSGGITAFGSLHQA